MVTRHDLNIFNILIIMYSCLVLKKVASATFQSVRYDSSDLTKFEVNDFQIFILCLKTDNLCANKNV